MGLLAPELETTGPQIAENKEQPTQKEVLLGQLGGRLLRGREQGCGGRRL